MGPNCALELGIRGEQLRGQTALLRRVKGRHEKVYAKIGIDQRRENH